MNARTQDGRRESIVLGLGLLTLAVSMLISLGLGSVQVPLDYVAKSVLGALTNSPPADVPASLQTVILDIRAPRIVLAVIVGAGLGIIGATVQGLLRNPLADPYIIGVTSGASLGAVCFMILGVGSAFGLTLGIGAFAGAVFAFILVLAMAHHDGTTSPLRLILCGVAVAATLGALTNFIVITADDSDQLRSALFWIMGSLNGIEWPGLVLPAITVAVIGGWLIAHGERLNVMSLGEETAASLGVNPNTLRLRLVTAAALVTGVLVAVSGGIGFVALVVPHIVRLLVGYDHRRLLAYSGIGGAIFLVWADVIARVANRPQELPIGVITAIVGGPVFLVLLRHRSRQGRL